MTSRPSRRLVRNLPARTADWNSLGESPTIAMKRRCYHRLSRAEIVISWYKLLVHCSLHSLQRWWNDPKQAGKRFIAGADDGCGDKRGIWLRLDMQRQAVGQVIW